MPPKKNTRAKTADKAATKDTEIDEEEEEEPVVRRSTRQRSNPNKPETQTKSEPKKTAKQSTKSKKTKDEDEDEEEDEEVDTKGAKGKKKTPTKDDKKEAKTKAGSKTQAKATAKQAAKTKANKPDESEDEEEEEETKKKTAAKGKAIPKKAAGKRGKKEESSSEEDEEEEVKKVKVNTKKSPAKATPEKARNDASSEQKKDATGTLTPAQARKPRKLLEKAKQEAKAKGGVDTESKDEAEPEHGTESKPVPMDKVKGEVDSEMPLKIPNRVLTSGKVYDESFVEEDPDDPSKKRFFLIQIIENYKSTFKTNCCTYYRFGEVGQKGEWSLRGYFDPKKAKKIFDDKLEERRKEKNAILEKRRNAASQTTQTTTQNTLTVPGQNLDTQPMDLEGLKSPNPQNFIRDDGDQTDQTAAANEMVSETTTTTAVKATEGQETQDSGDKKEGMDLEEKKESVPAKSKLNLERMEIKVDKYCPIIDDVEVFVKDDEIFDTTLNVSDIARNSNHFYIFQILRFKSDRTRFCVFFRYGRVGLMGEWNMKGGLTEEQAIKTYRAKQEEKNQQKKYTSLEMSYMKDDPEIMEKAFRDAAGKSALPKPVAEFIQLIFDFKMMNNQMAQAGYDVKKLPLGKLSLNSINKGFAVLSELSEAIKSNAGEERLQKLCSDFYTVIPQNVGWQNMKNNVIRDIKVIQEKVEFLESLKQIQVAYQMVYGEGSVALGDSVNPIDINYEKLKCDITPLDRSTEEFKKIQTFVDNTRESYNVEIMEAFKIDKHGSNEVFRKDLPNHVMLWHGSRLTNFVGILSQGLRIAPPEAPVSGYRLGKGIYLADVIGKSIPYCYASGSNNIFCIMVCETALGNCNEKLHDDYYASTLPSDKHSTKALGHKAPPVSSYVEFEKGVLIPGGKPERSEHQNSSFSHNEFIVYNVNQVQIRYLLKVKQLSGGFSRY